MDGNKTLIQSIIDIFTDLSEDNYIVKLQSARGFLYDISDLLSGGEITNYDNFFNRYSGSAKSFKINISKKRGSFDFMDFTTLFSDLKTEVMRVEDIGFKLSGLDLSDDKEGESESWL